ncbi:MAG: prolyl oligopeptidase family serine peptidase [Acidobacteria bacterium]|nr:prolyl oligopeptidase family serine peptidase [Acidobacteriota bacterium]MBI3423613.1 prolyl oligopeptidase family serine peptidase [Acidobacteriota bacterium]
MRKTHLLIALFAVPALFGITQQRAASAQSPGFTVEQVLSAPFASDLIAAPTGERIAWVFNIEGKRNIWVADGPDFKARQLTQFNDDDGQELLTPAFTHDGKWIVFVRGGEENQAGEIPNPTSDPGGTLQAIYAVNVDKGNIVPVALGNDPVVSPAVEADNKVVYSRNGKLWLNTIGADPKKAEPLFSARGNLGSAQWSPDGKQLAFVSNRNDHSFIGIYDLAKEQLRYLAPTLDRDSYPRWSPDGKRLAFVRQPTRGTARRTQGEEQPDPWAIWVADVATLKAKEIWRSGNKLDDSLPRWAGSDVIQWAADEQIVFRSEMDGWMHLYAVSANGGEAKLLTLGQCEVEQIALIPDKQTIVFSSNYQHIDGRRLWRIGVNGDDLEQMVMTGIQWNPIPIGKSSKLAYFDSNAQLPARVKIADLQTPRAIFRPKTPSVEELKDTGAITELPNPRFYLQLISPEVVTFKAADGLDIHGQLFLPKDAKPGEKLPAVIFSHGGPMRQMLLGWHSMYYYHNTYAFNQFLASRGYAVLSVNYRGGIGYGRAFREAAKRGGRGASEYQDIVAGAQYLRGRADIDVNRIGLWGGSYGGFLTALGLARNSDLFAAGVDIHGVHDWASRITGGEASDRDAVKIARDSSPMYAVEKWRAPVLLIHGDDDRNVAFNQTTELARRLREQKVEFEQLVFPDEVHDFLLHRTWVAAFNAAFDFLERKLKNAKPRQTSSIGNPGNHLAPAQPNQTRSPFNLAKVKSAHRLKAPTGRHTKAQGNALGKRNITSEALKGRNNAAWSANQLSILRPFRAASFHHTRTQGIALGYPIAPRWGFLKIEKSTRTKTIAPKPNRAALQQQPTQPTRVDLLIRNGRLLDGSGANETRADLGITGDRITFIGDASQANLKATRTIDATGLVIAPGFIDPHTHADEDLSNAQRKANLNYLLQGVTTVVIGSDGRSPLPIGKKLDQLNAQGIGTNAIQLVGHGSVRGAVLGAADIAPTAEQLEKMRALVKQAMDDGAFGMSTGLYYAPGSFAKTEEVIELAKVVAARGGIYDSHMRDESSYNIGLLGSIEEVIRIGREAKLPVHISHIKALGVDVWGQSKDAIALIEKARAAGINITANQYPYTASGTSLTDSLVPRWAEAGGNAEMLKRLDDPAIRPRLVKEMEENMRRRGGANSLLITSGRNRALTGKRLDEIAKAAGKSPVEAAIDIIKTGGASVASFNMNEQDIEAFMKQPWVMTGSDGSGGHPRKYGTYPRKLNDYVLKRGVISLPRFIQASSAQVAETFGVKARGALRTGYFADVVVFDEKAVAETATYEQPEKLAVGMKFVVVNGKLAVEDGKYTGALAGRALRKTTNGE